MNKELEALIDRAGRERVFARASANGWTAAGAPEFVWRMIAVELILEQARQITPYYAELEPYL